MLETCPLPPPPPGSASHPSTPPLSRPQISESPLVLPVLFLPVQPSHRQVFLRDSSPSLWCSTVPLTPNWFFFLCQTHAKHFLHIIPFNPHSHPTRKAVTIPVLRVGKRPYYFVPRLLCCSPLHPGNALDLPHVWAFVSLAR